MDTAVVVALLALAGTIVTALLAWHSSTVKERTARINTAQEATERTQREADARLEAVRAAAERTQREADAKLERARAALEQARAGKDAEREQLLGLRNKRLEEMANQLGSARQALAIARNEASAAQSENEDLRAELRLLRGQHSDPSNEFGGQAP